MSEPAHGSEGDSFPDEQPITSALSTLGGQNGRRGSSRSRLGCMTCRKRKVKCDEVHPQCRQCTRLQLTCIYLTTPNSARTKSRKKAVSSHKEKNTASGGVQLQAPAEHIPAEYGAQGNSITHIQPATLATKDQWSLCAQQESVDRESQQLLPIAAHPLPELHALEAADHSWLSGETPLALGEDLWRPDILGEDSFWSNLPIFSSISAEQDSSLETRPRGNIASTDPLPDGAPTRSFLDRRAAVPSPTVGHGGSTFQHDPPPRSPVPVTDSQPSPNSILSFSDIPSSEVSLLRHFVDFAVPPILIGVEPRWTSARHALFKVAKSDPLVRHAICSFSALSLADENAISRSKCSSRTSTYFYDLALKELHAEIGGLTGGSNDVRRHENILASIFFLSYVELMMSSAPKHTLELLSRAHSISRNTQPSKSLLGNQLRIWLKLLDARVVSAGGEGIHLTSNHDLKDLEGPSDEPKSPAESTFDGEAPIISEAPQADAEEILFNCINHSAYNFYVQVLDFAGRIAHLDRWHRPRGLLADELKVMQSAQEILDDLDRLWGRRPATLNLATEKHDQLIRHVSDRLAKNVQTNLRTYVANFYACFVHVQRALFPHLPTTPQTSEAVERIMDLVRLCEGDHVKLSVSMLWPLMMAGCEAPDVATRAWLIRTVEAMNGGLGNTARTAKLIREICRRQESGHRADARTVMQELFGTIFAII